MAPFVYAGAAILSPALFAGAPQGKFSLNTLFDRAIEAGRLYGLRLEGTWMHVGTPAAIKAAAEAAIKAARELNRRRSVACMLPPMPLALPTSSTSPPRRRFCRC